ncbi:MAG: DUF433 domain-containing protein [Anaerolineae bacterium]|nr:DUF433 domain-containing protein [Anaerolineae bacterium]
MASPWRRGCCSASPPCSLLWASGAGPRSHTGDGRSRAQASGGAGLHPLDWRDLTCASFPGIETAPAVCGGDPRIARTRIPVWALVQARRLGTSEAELLRCYPALRAEDLANAWACYRAHRDEIGRQIRENEEV